MVDELHIQMYGLRNLPNELRTNFQLHGDPYDGDEEALQQLRELGIVHFRDDIHPHAVLINPEEGDKITKRRGFDAFVFRAIVDADTYEPRQWVDNVRDPDAMTLDEYIEKYGDDRSWLWWNEHRHVVTMTAYQVKCA